MQRPDYDVAVIGGGLVGAATAYGLASRGVRTALLDEGDRAYRASRGNFALVWVQSKGLGMGAYSAWTVRSSRAWPAFAAALREASGIDVSLQQPGGFHLCLSEAELERRRLYFHRLHNQPEMIPYDYEILDHAELKRRLPEIGPEVAGGSYCPLDGHVNSLRLFRALHEAFRRAGGTTLPNRPAETIAPREGGFRITTPLGEVAAGRIVLAAGNGNARLAPMVGLEAPVRPQRGQVIVTEKTAPFLHYPLATIRQTDEGGVMVGDSQEEAGYEDTVVGTGILGTMADRAVRMFPRIGTLNVVRTWSALRVMTRDGFPIYEESRTVPGAFLATCHSGVTLAAQHATELAGAVAAGALTADFAPFSAQRFHVPAHA
ncbi:NAD(P)/FAD-dependent oxidoreductase [Roseicella aquatilis]|uniref:FAD-binding oxidoreductase n=1 Tax=Roseicella aquatilis TaxID=2527868 RepID=A0A4R4D5E8_9PROT|nr:FAD-dependent oxidoreductase [Roseicella aquatilis]TCZ51922.1 FAD-binding oxidoreductase [Roseicella aquatilis]